MKLIKHCSAFSFALVLTIAGYGIAISAERMDMAAGEGGQTAGEYADDAMITAKVKAAFVDSQGAINSAAEAARRAAA